MIAQAFHCANLIDFVCEGHVLFKMVTIHRKGAEGTKEKTVL